MNILRKTIFLSFVAAIIAMNTSQAQSCDTLRNYNPADQFWQLTSGTSSFILGHENEISDGTNSYEANFWSESYTVGTATEVRALRFVPWKVDDLGTVDSIAFYVWGDNAGNPDLTNELGKEWIRYDEMTASQYTNLAFSTPANVSGTFHVGYEIKYDATQDTFALLGTQPATNFTRFQAQNPGAPLNGNWYNVPQVYSDNGGTAINTAFVLDVLTSTAPIPVVADFTFNAEACLGGSFSVDASNSQNEDQYDWFLSTNPFDANNVYDNSTGLTTTLTPTVSGGNQAIYLVANGGCRSDVAAYVATVYAPVNATVTTTDASCGNNDGQINITGATGGDNFYAYSITGGTNPQASGNFTGLAPGTYNIVVTTAGDACEYTETVTISNIPGETITAGTGQTICEGNPVTISASGNGTIEWFDGGTSVGNGASISVSPTTTTTYDAVLTDANGCTDTDQVTVTVNPANDATFSYSSSTLCLSGGNETPAINGTGTFTVTPATGLVFVSTSTGEINISSSSAGTYDITFTTTGVCGETSTETITLTSAPDASFSYNATEFCAETGTESPGFVPGSSAGNFTSTPSGLSLNGSNGVITLGTSSAGTYTVVNTIPASGSCPSATASETIIINALPSVNAGTDQEVCEGVAVTLTATGADTYTWDNGVTQGTPFTPNPGTITYTVTGQDATTGCQNTDDVIVTVNTLPAVIAGADETLCDYNDPITLSGSPAGGTFSGTGMIGSDFDPSIGVGTYTITYTFTDGNGCEGSDDLVITVDGCASIDENDINEGLTIMPNPATDYIDVVMDGSNTIQSIQLVSAEGRVIDVNMSTTNENTTRIDVSSSTKGTYFIQVNTLKGQITKKVIIQ